MVAEYIKENKKKLLVKYLIFGLILSICVIRIVLLFTLKKEGVHCDEAWSYGFANSFYKPYIYSESIDILETNENIRNYNEWLSKDIFNDYLTVNEGEQFRFDSVIYNKKGDMSPPFYEILLNAVSSFFPGVLSWWFGFFINIVCFFLIEILLFSISNHIFKQGSIWPYFVCFFYGMSLGGLNNIIYLRMYALLTVFCLWLVKLSICYLEKEKITAKYIISVFICIFLGAFSHYYFLLFAFFLVLYICLVLLFNKKYKECFIFGFLMLASVGGYFAIYPYGISIMLKSPTMYEEAVMLPYSWAFNALLDMFLIDTIGVHHTVDKYFFIYAVAIAISILFMLLMICFLCRKEVWYLKLTEKLKTRFISFGYKFRDRYHTRNSRKCSVIIPLCGTVVSSFLVECKICNIGSMGETADRYVFNLMPVFILLLFCLVSIIESNLKRMKVVFIVVIILLTFTSLFSQNFLQKCHYYHNKGENKTELSDYFYGKDVIIFTGSPYRLEWYSTMLLNVNSVMFVSMYDLEKAQEALEQLDNKKNVVFTVEYDELVADENVIGEGENRIITGNHIYKSLKLVYSDFFEELEKMNNKFCDRNFEFSQKGFCGKLEIYSIE